MIGIVGAGPIGSYLAWQLAERGKDVCLFEEHDEIGKPVQCTGIVTSALNELVELKEEFIVNKLRKVRIVAPSNKDLVLTLRKENIVLDREKFDKYLVDKAVKEGAKLFLKHKFLDYKKGVLSFENKKKIKTEIVVGADGANSRVASLFNVKRKFMSGVQARVKGDFRKDVFEIYLGVGDFAWVVPENEKIARIGLISRRNTSLYFENFLRKFNCKVLEYQGGLIPVYNHSLKLCRGNIFLVGDAASQVKMTTYGGLVPGFLAAKALARAILKGGDYKKLLGNVNRELNLALMIRKILNKFSAEDYGFLVELCRRAKVKKILENYERDFPSMFLLKMVLNEPRFLKFGFKTLLK